MAKASEADSDFVPPREYPSDRVVVVGGGLVGSLLSIYLARQGFQVEVYERRPDMRKEAIGAGRSINLAVSTRGLFALKEIGLEQEVLKHAIPMRGRMIHSPKGELTFQQYGKDDSECINSISRGELNKVLMTHAEATGKVRYHFHQKATGFDRETGSLQLQHQVHGLEAEVDSPLMIGTDGSASAIRSAMIQSPGYECTQSYLEYGYKELTIPAGEDGGSFRMEKNALHIWPRGTFMLIALPNFDGSFTCTLFLPFEGAPSFRSLSTPAQVREFFSAQFPDALPLIPDLEEAFFEHPTGNMVTVKGFPWSARTRQGHVLLLGDAAHAIVPFFGQGMNCGFEDCTVLDRLLRQSAGREKDWSSLFGQFERIRKPNCDAIADMAVENFVEMRDRVGDPRFLMMKEVEKILQKEFPGGYVSRYSLVTFSRVLYTVAYEAGRVQEQILSELCQDLGNPKEVNLERADELIRSRLAPLLKNAPLSDLSV